MARINVRCANCGEIATASVAQSIQLNGVNWSMSYKCVHCDEFIEYDDNSLTPQNVREAILEFNGGVVLKLNLDKENKIKAAKSLNALFRLSTPNALKMVARIIEENGVAGTEKEIGWLAENSRKSGVDFYTEEIPYTESTFLDYNTLAEGKLLVPTI